MTGQVETDKYLRVAFVSTRANALEKLIPYFFKTS